ncbi:serine/threonine-protein kinase Chk2 isoform X2 [Anabrus simplex]|uniref:serine/threonine-protein kinase Chk2 isoform X2 n=1 Tax=Anabrus simplex TaxID=316456 RepID=UPI0035A2EEF4
MEQKSCWGYLVPCPVESPPIELHKTEILAGRDTSCDIVLQGNLLGCKQENISKHHFRLVHGAQGAVLKNESRTATFVNGRLVSGGKQEAIYHGARIDIIRRGIKAFVFLDRAVSDNGNHPKSIKDKYVMGNLLGEGNFGKVFLVLDKAALKRYAMKMVKNSHVAKREAQILCEIRHPANILLVTSSPHTLIKVTDFGLAKDEVLHSDMTTCAGTGVYLAPEIIMSPPYTNKVDIWSMGVILYYSLIGKLPFHTLSEARRLRHEVKFVAEEWAPVSLTALELVKRMLVTSPERRANANEVLVSRWLQDEPMKEDADSLMGSNVAQSPASPTIRNTPEVARNKVSPARVKAVSPAKVITASPARINVASPARLNVPSHTPQNRTPGSPRGVLQNQTRSSGADKPKAGNPPIRVTSVPARNQSPNELRGRSPTSPKKQDNSPALVTPHKPRHSAEGVGVKLTVEHQAQKTFLIEARRNLKASPWKP